MRGKCDAGSSNNRSFSVCWSLTNALAGKEFYAWKNWCKKNIPGKNTSRSTSDDVTLQRNLQVKPVCHHWHSVSSFIDLGTVSLPDPPYCYHCLNAFKNLFIISL